MSSDSPALPGSAQENTIYQRMIEQLRIDYRAMQGMIFGDPPAFEAVIDSIASLEASLNKGAD